MNQQWNLKSSRFGLVTINPLRIIWEREQPTGNPKKSEIILQAGDPTTHGNFPPHPDVIEALSEGPRKDKFNYDYSSGLVKSRQAVADYSKHIGKITADDVILTSGCSMAIEHCFVVLANPGENILIPRPAWNYTTWMDPYNIEAKSYNLNPNNDWNVDLKHMESLIDEKTKAILVNNPGNPCGNVFSKEHILDIIAIAERHQLPIIADEVYEFLTFSGVEFHSFAELSKNVPVLVCSGLTKRFLIPNVRMGWIIISDRDKKLEEIRLGLLNIAGRNFGPNSSIQLALPKILTCIPQEFFDHTTETVGHNAMLAFKVLSKAPGLKANRSFGAFYMMVEIDHKRFPKLPTCIAFMRRLAEEESVFVFPGKAFDWPGSFRIVLTAPEEMLRKACERMVDFCSRYYETK